MAICEDCIHNFVCKYGENRSNGLYCTGEKCKQYQSAADVVPRSEVEQLKRNLEQCENGYSQEMHLLRCKLANAKSEVAREIFEGVVQAIEKGVSEGNAKVKDNPMQKLLSATGEMFAGYVGICVAQFFKKYMEEKKQ